MRTKTTWLACHPRGLGHQRQRQRRLPSGTCGTAYGRSQRSPPPGVGDSALPRARQARAGAGGCCRREGRATVRNGQRPDARRRKADAADGRPIDTLALLMVCDAFPLAVFHLDMPPGWVPTVELTVHVRGVPAPGPVSCVFRSQFVQGGCFNEDRRGVGQRRPPGRSIPPTRPHPTRLIELRVGTRTPGCEYPLEWRGGTRTGGVGLGRTEWHSH